MNTIKKIAKFYGVSLLEEFSIIDECGLLPAKYRFSDISGLEMKIQDPNNNKPFWIAESGYVLVKLLTGRFRIKKE